MWVMGEGSIHDGIKGVWNGIAATFFEESFTN